MKTAEKERLEREELMRKHRAKFILCIEKYAKPEGQAAIINLFDLMIQQAEMHGVLLGVDRLNNDLLDGLTRDLFTIKTTGEEQ